MSSPSVPNREAKLSPCKHDKATVKSVEAGVFQCRKCYRLVARPLKTASGVALGVVLCEAGCRAKISTATQLSPFYQCTQMIVCLACDSPLSFTVEKMPEQECRCAKCAGCSMESPERLAWKPVHCKKVQQSPRPNRYPGIVRGRADGVTCARRLTYDNADANKK